MRFLHDNIRGLFVSPLPRVSHLDLFHLAAWKT